MPGTDTYLGLRAFVDELARCGLRDACTSPGSRSTPLVLSLARSPRVRATSHLDERCAAFFALGLAKAGGVPAALACTSGTAAANYAPAVIEAHEARGPLLMLTADRPPELRNLGAGQTIDQVKLYGSAAKWSLEVDDHPASPARVRWLRQLACRAFWTAIDGRPGPVHLNFAFREPLVPDAGGVPEDEIVPGREGGRPWVTRPRSRLEASDALLGGLEGELAARPRAVVVAGRAERDPGLGAGLAAFAERAGVPLLADPLSGARRGPAAIAHYDALLRDDDWATAHRPDLVLRIGDLPTSKPLRRWLHDLDDALQVTFDPENVWQDPAGAVATIIPADPRPPSAPETGGRARPGGAATTPPPAPPLTLDAVAARFKLRPDRSWIDAWRRADREASTAIAQALGPAGLSEPQVAAELGS